ncbi:MAG: DUF4294 domain-containing protein [Bacteroidaceae bacterium]|nr:DUF4294 domain-containing protein [Bacteroidaceae bacterium]
MQKIWCVLLFAACALQSVRAAGVAVSDTLQPIVYVHVNRAFYQGDSIPNVTLHKFICAAPMTFRSERARARYNRMVANVKYVFPMAQLAKQTLIETYDYLQTLPDEKSRKEHIARVEKGVKEQYTPLIKKMSRSQGKLLVKLINRECGQTSFDMVKAFLGPLRANFYQIFAGLYGNSLTKKYDPEGEDRYTERIVQMVEAGQL